MGAIATGDVRIINYEVVELLGIRQETIDNVTEQERQELRRREELYRGHSRPPALAGKSVILVDDGIATGSTMRAATATLRQSAPARRSLLCRLQRRKHIAKSPPSEEELNQFGTDGWELVSILTDSSRLYLYFNWMKA